jgi:hypothetical protein
MVCMWRRTVFPRKRAGWRTVFPCILRGSRRRFRGDARDRARAGDGAQAHFPRRGRRGAADRRGARAIGQSGLETAHRRFHLRPAASWDPPRRRLSSPPGSGRIIYRDDCRDQRGAEGGSAGVMLLAGTRAVVRGGTPMRLGYGVGDVVLNHGRVTGRGSLFHVKHDDCAGGVSEAVGVAGGVGGEVVELGAFHSQDKAAGPDEIGAAS